MLGVPRPVVVPFLGGEVIVPGVSWLDYFEVAVVYGRGSWFILGVD